MPTTGVPTPRPLSNSPPTPSPPMKTPNKNTVASVSPSNAPQYDTTVQSTTQQVVIHPDEQSEQSLLLVETVSFCFQKIHTILNLNRFCHWYYYCCCCWFIMFLVRIYNFQNLLCLLKTKNCETKFQHFCFFFLKFMYWWNHCFCFNCCFGFSQ